MNQMARWEDTDPLTTACPTMRRHCWRESIASVLLCRYSGMDSSPYMSTGPGP